MNAGDKKWTVLRKTKICDKCQGTGPLIQCGKCENSFHPYCIDLPVEEIPDDEWNCSECMLTLTERIRRRQLGEFLPEELKSETISTASDFRYDDDAEMGTVIDEDEDVIIMDSEDEADTSKGQFSLGDSSDHEEISSSSEGYQTSSSDETVIINGRKYMSKARLVSKFNQIHTLSVFDPAAALYNEFVKKCHCHSNNISNRGYKPIYCMFSISGVSNDTLILTVFSSRTYEPRYIAQLVPLKIMSHINLELIFEMEERKSIAQHNNFIRNKASVAEDIYKARALEQSERLL